jgi:ABC-type sulfate transport system substrate-binding protein
MAALTPLLKTTLYSPRVMTKVSSLGGWTQVNNKFFSPHGIITKAEAAHGYTS